MMKRNNLSAKSSYYEETYHGKVQEHRLPGAGRRLRRLPHIAQHPADG